MKSQKVLITGSAGFLGSHLCDQFVKEGYKVIGIDNLLTGRLNNLSQLDRNSAFTFIHKDVTIPIILDQDIDIVLHFACPASPNDYLNHPIHTMKVDSLGTLYSLGLAKLKNARYVLASSSEVYGSAEVHPQNETYWGNVNPIGPRSVYDEAKRFSEALTMAYHREHDLDTRILRIFNTYGPRMRINDGRVIPAFFSQALRSESLTIFGDGTQTRSFCYIDDLIQGIFLASTLDSLSGEVINLGNPNEIHVLQLAKMVTELTQTSSLFIHETMPIDDPIRRKPDILKAHKLMGWSPKVPLSEGLKSTLLYFQSEMQLIQNTLDDSK